MTETILIVRIPKSHIFFVYSTSCSKKELIDNLSEKQKEITERDDSSLHENIQKNSPDNSGN